MVWYKKVKRWCQTNLTEIDGKECNVATWELFWDKNRVDGIIVNASGIVSYYPSEEPLQYISPYLHGRDLVGEFVVAARKHDLSVVARMDINRASRTMYEAHPEWFAVDKTGKPYCVDGWYIACVNGDYVKKYIPKRLEEIYKRYQPDGFTDNSWQGLPAGKICYCSTCQAKFQGQYHEQLPQEANWNDDIYRHWIEWSIQCRMENWQLFNEITQSMHEDCLWLGMVNADPVNAHCAMYDLKTIARSTPFLMVDHQVRDSLNGFEQNLFNGLLLHELGGSDTVITESMAHYSRGVYTFRRSAMPAKELETWMLCGVAGGILPWLHIVGGKQKDQRLLTLDQAWMKWHSERQEYLENRKIVANIGLVWSQRNVVFYGQNAPEERCGMAWRGFVHAMVRAGIPFVPVCASDMPTNTCRFQILILPDVAVLEDYEIDRLEQFIRAGGSILVTGSTGMLDSYGRLRNDHRVDRLLGIHRTQRAKEIPFRQGWDHYELHSYLSIEQSMHPIFAGFSDTEILPFGGWTQPIQAYDSRLEVLAGYLPSFPFYPPEFAYMRTEKSECPSILAGETEYGGKEIVLLADVERRYGHGSHPDHGDILANMIFWLQDRPLPYHVAGNGYLAASLYYQQDGLILHLVNLSGLEGSGVFAEYTLPCEKVRVMIDKSVAPELERAESLVNDSKYILSVADDEYTLEIPRVEVHDCLWIPFKEGK